MIQFSSFLAQALQEISTLQIFFWLVKRIPSRKRSSYFSKISRLDRQATTRVSAISAVINFGTNRVHSFLTPRREIKLLKACDATRSWVTRNSLPVNYLRVEFTGFTGKKKKKLHSKKFSLGQNLRVLQVKIEKFVIKKIQFRIELTRNPQCLPVIRKKLNYP